MTDGTTTPPIVCDMTDAPDTSAERVAEYEWLYANHLLGRERTDDGIRFRLRSHDEVERRVRRLAALEKECCAFLDFDVTRHHDEIHWDVRTVEDEIARQVLDELYQLPDTIRGGLHAVFERFPAPIVIRDRGDARPATREDLGLDS